MPNEETQRFVRARDILLHHAAEDLKHNVDKWRRHAQGKEGEGMSTPGSSSLRLLPDDLLAGAVEQSDMPGLPDHGSTRSVREGLRGAVTDLPAGEGTTAEASFAYEALRKAGYPQEAIRPVVKWFNRKDTEELF